MNQQLSILQNLRKILSFQLLFLLSIGMFTHAQTNPKPGFLWMNDFSGTGNVFARANLVNEADGSLLVAGWFNGTATFGSHVLTSNGNSDLFIAKFDSEGTPLWAQSQGGPEADWAAGMGTDSGGNIYVTGQFRQTVSFGPNPQDVVTSAGREDIFVACYDAAGNYQWVQRFGGPNVDTGQSLVVDGNGNISLSGFVTTPVNLGTLSLTDPALGEEAFLMQLNAVGGVNWTIAGSGPGFDSGGTLTIDSSGDLYWTGNFLESLTLDGITYHSVTSTDTNLFLVKITAAGSFDWVVVDSGAGNSWFNDLALTPTGELIATGGAVGTLNLAGQMISGRTVPTGTLVKFNANGAPLWIESIQSDTAVFANGVTVGASGQIAVAGSYLGTLNFNGQAYPATGDEDGFVLSFAADGSPLWARPISGPAINRCLDITFDAAENISITGVTQGATAITPCTTINAAPLNNHLLLGKLAASGNVARNVTLVGPTDGASINTGTPTLEWQPIIDADGVQYTLTMARDINFTQDVQTISGLAVQYHTLTTPLGDGTWYWQVTAVDNCGDMGPASMAYAFTIDTSIRPVIASVDVRMNRPELNQPADLTVDINNLGVSSAANLKVDIYVCRPGSDWANLTIPDFSHSIATLAPNETRTLADTYTQTDLEGFYAVLVQLYDAGSAFIFDSDNSLGFSVGAPRIKRFVLINSDFNGGFLPGSSIQFDSDVRNESTQSQTVQRQIQVFDSAGNPANDINGDPVCLSAPETTLAPNGADASIVIGGILPTGSYIAELKATGGNACAGPGQIWDTQSIPFQVSMVEVANTTAPSPAYQDQNTNIRIQVANRSTTETLQNATVNLEIHDALGFSLHIASQPIPPLGPTLAQNFDFAFTILSDAVLGLYGYTVQIRDDLGNLLNESTESFQVDKAIAITLLQAQEGNGQNNNQVDIKSLNIVNRGDNARNLTINCTLSQGGAVLETLMQSSTLAPGPASQFGRTFATVLTPGNYEVTVEVTEAGEILDQATAAVTIQ